MLKMNVKVNIFVMGGQPFNKNLIALRISFSSSLHNS